MCITSSKDSEKLEKSLCVRDKAEDLCWMPVVFGPSDGTHRHDSVIDITKWAQEYFTETNVGKHNPPCHLQMPNKALSCKKEAMCEHGPEAPSCSVGQGSFKMYCFKVEKCSMVRRVQVWHSCCKSQTPCPPGLRGGRPPIVISIPFKSQHLWWYGGAYVYTVWAACMFWKALWMLKSI